jgi:hypothetical protein
VEGFTGGFEPSIIATLSHQHPSTHSHVQASTSKISREKLYRFFKTKILISNFQQNL